MPCNATLHSSPHKFNIQSFYKHILLKFNPVGLSLKIFLIEQQQARGWSLSNGQLKKPLSDFTSLFT